MKPLPFCMARDLHVVAGLEKEKRIKDYLRPPTAISWTY